MNEEEQNTKMVQFVDVSLNVERQNIKQHNELLNLINATVSHELRNPLNSISSQNIENNFLYDQICALLTNESFDSDQIN